MAEDPTTSARRTTKVALLVVALLGCATFALLVAAHLQRHQLGPTVTVLLVVVTAILTVLGVVAVVASGRHPSAPQPSGRSSAWGQPTLSPVAFPTEPEDPDAVVAVLVAALVPDLCDECSVELVDQRDRRDAGADEGVAAQLAGLDAVRDRVLAGRTSETWRPQDVAVASSCAVVALLDGDTVVGTVACVTTAGRRALDAVDVAAIEAVAAPAGASVGRALLRQRVRDAARHSQRLASQLHQLIAASIAVAGLRAESEVLDGLAARARSVFDADETVVALDTGPGAPLRVTARRGDDVRLLTTDHPVPGELLEAARAGTAPVRDGDWLVVPLLVRHGPPRGTVAVRRRAGTTSSDDDVEVASLLAQTASSALDATELNRTILRSEERLRVLVDTAPVGIVETDLTGAIQWWNRAATSLFEWPVVGALEIGRTPAFPSDSLLDLQTLWASAAAGEPVNGHDLAGVEIAGRRRELAVSVALVPPAADRAGSLLTVVEDVTDHRQLMEELRHAQRMEVIGQLSSSVAHDFNNLLTLIAGYAELLTMEAKDERTTQLARDIQTTTTRASTLTGKLLTMGRTKLPAPVVFSPVTAVGGIAEVLDRILGADVKLVLTLDPASGSVRADPDQFEQMVMNLATNARDAMDEGGVLRITVAPVVLGDRDASSLGVSAGEFVRIDVEDNGSGMDQETARRSFEPLFTTKGPSKGTGLGLPAAKRVVVEAGGSITCRSQVGVGTTFEIVLPSVVGAPVKETPAPLEVRPMESATVLVAEDEDGIRELVERVLRHNGFQVLVAESGERALEVSRAFDGVIDLLVTDVVMPGMTGGELARTLQGERPEVLVVLMSGNVDATILENVAEGTGSFLPKPFRPSELVGVLAELRARHEATREH